MIAIRDIIPTITVKISTALVSNSIEVVSVNLLLRKPTTLCCIYMIPPCTDDLLLSEVIQYFSTLINSYPRNLLVLVSDFNLPDANSPVWLGGSILVFYVVVKGSHSCVTHCQHALPPCFGKRW